MLLLGSSAYLLLSVLATYSSWGARAFPNLPMDLLTGVDAQTHGLQQAALQDILRRGYTLMGQLSRLRDNAVSQQRA